MKSMVLPKGNFFPLNSLFTLSVPKKRVRSRKLHNLVGTDFDKVFEVKKIEHGDVLIKDVSKKSVWTSMKPELVHRWCSIEKMQDPSILKEGRLFRVYGIDNKSQKLFAIYCN